MTDVVEVSAVNPPDTRTAVKKVRIELQKLFPDAHCELNFSNPLQLLIAVMLSAQATDVSVNKATPALFAAYESAESYARAPLTELENHIRSIGLYKNKAKNIQAAASILAETHGGRVPSTREALEALPGVGRKTANVVLSVAFGMPAFAVDTHVSRVSWRLGFTLPDSTPLAVEQTLTALIPKPEWSVTHHRMILFGRYHCKAKTPLCDTCPFVHGPCIVAGQFLK